jgi:hypothetical protein
VPDIIGSETVLMLIRICLAHNMTCVSAISLKVVEENVYVIAKYGLHDDHKYVTIRKYYVLVLNRCVILLEIMTLVQSALGSDTEFILMGRSHIHIL